MVTSKVETLQNKRILITGAGGFLGSHLVEHLLEEGACVGGLDLSEGKLKNIKRNHDFAFISCDLNDSQQF